MSKSSELLEIGATVSPRDVPSRACCERAPTPALIHAFTQFNRGEFWEQHETLETIWRAETDPSIRNFYKGVLQIGVGFYHLRRANYDGTIKVLGRGIKYLEPYAPVCCGLDVERLVAQAKDVYRQVVAAGPDGVRTLKDMPLPRLVWR